MSSSSSFPANSGRKTRGPNAAPKRAPKRTYEIARALRDCDLLFFPARREEGFGLPLLEALASGLPAVASRIPSAEFMTDGAVPLVDAGNPDGFADAAQALLGDRGRWRRARERGLAAAERFAPERIAPLLADAVRWAAGAEARNRDT